LKYLIKDFKVKNVSYGVEQIFKSVMNCEDIIFSQKLTADDVSNWDSMSNIILLIELERHFSIRFNPMEVFGIPNIGSLIELIELKLKIND